MAETRIIRRRSLGRVAFIGSLYNATSDTFGPTILKSEYPNDSVRKADIPNTEILYEYEDTYKEKFEKLDVGAELKLSVLAGLFTLEGSGKYLNDVKESLKTIKGTLIYKMTSVEENLDIHRDDVKTCISTDGIINNQNATHVVIGIKWGAAIMASFECKDTNKENRSQVEGALKCHFEKITISGEGHVDVDEGQSNIINRFSIKLLGDVVPNDKELPQSFDEARKVIAGLPLYIKQYNNGKGVPIEYTLYPLSELAKLLTQDIKIDNIITELGDETILRVEQAFDDLSESKQRLNDLCIDAQSIFDLIPDEVFDKINNRVKEVRINEAKFRRELAECLVKVRSGKSNISELENKLKIFHKGVLSKNSMMEFIQQHRLVSTLAELVLILKAKKVEYLGKNSTIEHILNKYSTNEIYILFDYDDEYIIDGNSSPVHSMFRDLYNSDERSSKFFIVNLKICTQIKCLSYPTIQHYINGRLNSNNYYDDNKVWFTSNLVKFDPLPNIKPKNDPNEKTRLVVPCPQDCPTVDCNYCNWRCLRCKQSVEYGYNQHLYCECGESNITHSKFKCNSPHHTKGYISFELNKLNDLLPLAPPQEEINILLLGETGVGKSTFINAFANYLKFNTLNNAKSGDIEVLIPSEFTITDDDYEAKTIKLGNYDPNEQFDIGESSTRECKSYVFHSAGNKLIRLIDTPGIGDTKGSEHDKKNFENILWYINYYRYLNGICILLKPNNSRLNVVFKFCIQELLSHLHKNAKDNIVFCFTNARQTNYRPGDTLQPLKKQLEDLKKQSKSGVEIKVHKDTMYCFDNESFRFLAAFKENIQFTKSEKQNFAESWERSVSESLRLIEYLVKRQPHVVEDTLSLNNSRKIVILLSKPLAEIERLIQQNIILIKEKQQEIKNSNKTIEELEGNLYIPQIDIVPVKLGYPRTVCTNSNCVDILQIGNNIGTIDYIKHCCSRCSLRFSRYNVINNKVLMLCSAIKLKDGKCKVCGCLWDKHMHITYENKYIINDIIDKNIEKQISEKRSDQETKRAIIEEHQRRVDQLRKEQGEIKEISLKFAQFLRQNAIAAFNDAYADYLDLFIKGEKIKRDADPSHYDDRVLKELEITKDTYVKQVEVIKQAIENNKSSKTPITPKEIAELEQQLYNLPINGQTLKRLKYEAERSQTDAFKYAENHYMPSISNKINFKSNPFAKIFG
jgi:GTPase SAR1 family protein